MRRNTRNTKSLLSVKQAILVSWFFEISDIIIKKRTSTLWYTSNNCACVTYATFDTKETGLYLFRKLPIQLSKLPLILLLFNLCYKTLWSTLQNAFEKSWYIISTCKAKTTDGFTSGLTTGGISVIPILLSCCWLEW